MAFREIKSLFFSGRSGYKEAYIFVAKKVLENSNVWQDETLQDKTSQFQLH